MFLLCMISEFKLRVGEEREAHFSEPVFVMIKYDCLLSYAVDRFLVPFMRSARQ